MLKIFTDFKSKLSEGPLYDEMNNRTLYVDIPASTFHIVDGRTGEDTLVQLESPVGFLALTPDGRILAGLKDGIYYVTEAGECTLAHKPMEIKGGRFNDGKAGPDGAIYAGTIGEEEACAFYRLSHAGELRELFDGVTISNGLDWSPDNKTMYYIDTPKRIVEAFDFDIKTGSLNNRRTVLEVQTEGNPDGMCTDDEGNLWVSMWGGNCVAKYSAGGELLGTIPVPAKATACCAFATANRNRMVIASCTSPDELDEPDSGKMFYIDLDVTGRKPFLYMPSK